MKKLFALVLVLALMLAPAAAFAVDTEATESPVTEVPRAVIPKHLTTEGGAISPAETFEFTFTGNEEGNPLIPNTEIPFASHTSGTITGEIDLSAFANDDVAVGRYTYTVWELVGTTAGFTYTTRTGTLFVDKEHDKTIKSYLIIGTVGNAQEKFDNFDNKFEGGHLYVDKLVTGNLGDPNKEFTLKVTLTAPAGKTVKTDAIFVTKNGVAPVPAIDVVFNADGVATLTLTVTKDDYYGIMNLPKGVSYAIVENGVVDGKVDGYTVTYSDNINGVVDQGEIRTTVTNHKDSEVPTGITLDNMPYFILLAVALAGVGVFVLRKRAHS